MKTIFILISALYFFQLNTVEINLDETFTIDKTEQAILESENIIISVGKIKDSRCPVNTNCVWAGELSIDIAITFGNETITKTLVKPAIGDGGSKAQCTFDKYVLQFLGEENHKAKKELTQTDTTKSEMRLAFVLSEE